MVSKAQYASADSSWAPFCLAVHAPGMQMLLSFKYSPCSFLLRRLHILWSSPRSPFHILVHPLNWTHSSDLSSLSLPLGAVLIPPALSFLPLNQFLLLHTLIAPCTYHSLQSCILRWFPASPIERVLIPSTWWQNLGCRKIGVVVLVLLILVANIIVGSMC